MQIVRVLLQVLIIVLILTFIAAAVYSPLNRFLGDNYFISVGTIAILAFIYALLLGRGGMSLYWAVGSFVLPFIVPVVLAFMRDDNGSRGIFDMRIIGRILGNRKSHGSASNYSASCMLCGHGIYSRDVLLYEQSIYVQAGLSGKAREIESALGYRCKSCGRVYCKRCLETRAPSNSADGKACPSCGGNFGYLT